MPLCCARVKCRAGGIMGLIRGERCLELTASSDLPALQPLLRPSGKMDRGIDLTGPVSFRVRSSRNEDIHPVDERTDYGTINGSRLGRFRTNCGGRIRKPEVETRNDRLSERPSTRNLPANFAGCVN